jgi:hypothetical protein
MIEPPLVTVYGKQTLFMPEIALDLVADKQLPPYHRLGSIARPANRTSDSLL